MSDKYLNDEGLEHLVDKIKSLVIVSSGMQDNAASHNAFYVEEDITEMYNDGTFTRNVENGTFKDIFPGMYITKTYTAAGIESNITEDFVVGDLDYFMNSGDTKLTTHHALMLMKNGSTVKRGMNSSDTESGGYLGSEMWTTTIPEYVTAMGNAFGSSHIVSHREDLVNAISTANHTAENTRWIDVKFNLMNNNMAYGSQITGSSLYDVGNRTQQIAAMRHNSHLKIGHDGKGKGTYSYWLSDVAKNYGFSYASSTGKCDRFRATYSGCIRGYFLLK